MHELYELKEKLCDELKDYGTKEVTAGNLEVIDKLAHATKNIDRIIEKYEESDYSGRSYPDGMGGSYRSYRGYSRRGRYSGADDVDGMKREIHRLMEKVDKM